MVDVKWSSPTDLTVSGGATYTQADLDAVLDRAKEEAFNEGFTLASTYKAEVLEAISRQARVEALEEMEDMHERAWSREAERGAHDKAFWHRDCAEHLRAMIAAEKEGKP